MKRYSDEVMLLFLSVLLIFAVLSCIVDVHYHDKIEIDCKAAGGEIISNDSICVKPNSVIELKHNN